MSGGRSGFFPVKLWKRLPAVIFAGFFCVSATFSIGFWNAGTYAEEYSAGSSDVNVRSGPGTEYEVLGTLPYDYKFSPEDLVTDSGGQEWYQFSYTDEAGQTANGYVRKDLVVPMHQEEDSTVSAEAEDSIDPADEQDMDTAEEQEPDSAKEPEPETEDEDQDPSSEEAESEPYDILYDELTEYDQELLDSLFAPGNQTGWSGYIQSEAEFEAQLSQFPASYHAGLRAVHAEYPNYRFIADYPGMDFWELVDAEKGKKIEDIYPESYRAMYDDSFGYYQNYNWNTDEWSMSEGRYTYASDEVIAYFLDPRNFLNTSEIYMFVRQSYSGNTSIDDLRSFLEGTFLAKGYTPNPYDADDVRLKGDYAAVLMEAAQISGVSPFVLATTIFSEQGYSGDSPLIYGYYEVPEDPEEETTAQEDSKSVEKKKKIYVSYYNFFNFGATGSDNNDVIVNGLEYAKNAGWISRYRSIVDSAVSYGRNYINNDQDTYYYKNFNVLNGYNALWHQYATAVTNSYGSGMIMKEVMEDSKYAALEFRIPVYENMPDSAAQLPESSSSKNNYYFADMQATGLEPAFSMSNHNYTMVMTGDAKLRIAVPQWATYEGYDSYAISSGETLVRLDVRSQTGYLRSYYITVTSSVSCTLYVETYEAARLSISDEIGAAGSSRGDANGDGKVSTLDYIAIKNHIMETNIITDPERLAAADANGDGRVSTLDYIAVKNYIMSK